MKQIYFIKCVFITLSAISLIFFIHSLKAGPIIFLVHIIQPDISTATLLRPPIDDSAIISKLQSNIDLDSDLSGESITVTSNQGVVTLEGEVSSQDKIAIAIDVAIQTAKEMHGISAIKSDLYIEDTDP